jgi:hypothetical protein
MKKTEAGQSVQVKPSTFRRSRSDVVRKKDEARLEHRRLDRLKLLAETIPGASARLGSQGTWPETIKVRHRFFYHVPVQSGLHPSDRRLPAPESRPPCTKIMSPRGIALRFYLLTLCEAQIRTRKGMRPGNALPLRAGGEDTGWIDLIAVPVERHSGNVYVSVADKKQRMVQSALRRLSSDSVTLVALPNSKRRVGRYEEFQLLDEGGERQNAEPIEYTVPSDPDICVNLPVGLFRNGWIHCLEDTEIAFILMLAHCRGLNKSGELFKIGSDTRIENYGIGRDAYSSHEMLRRFGLLEVETEADRRGLDIHDFWWGKERLHKFRLINSGFDEPATNVIKDMMPSRLF